MPTAHGPAASEPPLSDDRGVLPGAPHPLGIRPWGSLLFSSDGRDASRDGDADVVVDAASGGGDGGAGQKKKKRPRLASNPRLGLGDLCRLPDAALLVIVASLPARDLASVSCASRALYAFAFSAADGGVEEEEEKDGSGDAGGDDQGRARKKAAAGIGGWRSATLSDFGGSWAWGGTWARTYAAAAWARREEEEERKEGRGGGSGGGEDGNSAGGDGDDGGEERGHHASFVAACERALSLRLPPAPPRVRVPLFSDALYETWAATAADPEPWLARDSLPRVAASALSPAEFARRFDGPALPVVLVGAAKRWPALEEWKSDKYLLRVLSGGVDGGEGEEEEEQNEEGGRGGSKKRKRGKRAAETVHVGGVEVSWKHFAEYAATNADDSPLTVFDSKVLSRIRQLREDLGEGPPECLPVAMDDDDGDGEEKKMKNLKKRKGASSARERDLFSVLPKHLRPDHEWLIAGGRRSGSGFHIDPNATSAWNAVVRGSKKWVLWPPGAGPPGVEASADLSTVTAPAALADWFRGFYDEAFGGNGEGGGEGPHRRQQQQQQQRSFSGRLLHRPLEGIVSAGDAVFVPRGWWHAVLNLETPTIAVTTNFVSRAGLPQALRWVRSGDAELVSGVRGEEARHQLARRWERALRERAPEALAEAEESIAREDAAAEARRSRERALASLFKEREGEKGKGGEEAAAAAAAPSSAVPAAAAASGGGFSFNFAVED